MYPITNWLYIYYCLYALPSFLTDTNLLEYNVHDPTDRKKGEEKRKGSGEATS